MIGECYRLKETIETRQQNVIYDPELAPGSSLPSNYAKEKWIFFWPKRTLEKPA